MVVGAISMMRLAMISHLLEILRSSNDSIRYYRRSGINQVLQKVLTGCSAHPQSIILRLHPSNYTAKGGRVYQHEIQNRAVSMSNVGPQPQFLPLLPPKLVPFHTSNFNPRYHYGYQPVNSQEMSIAVESRDAELPFLFPILG